MGGRSGWAWTGCPGTFIHPILFVRMLRRRSARSAPHLRVASVCCAPTPLTPCRWRWRKQRRPELTPNSESSTSGEHSMRLLLPHRSPCPIRLWLKFVGFWVGASPVVGCGNLPPVAVALPDSSLLNNNYRPWTVGGAKSAPQSSVGPKWPAAWPNIAIESQRLYASEGVVQAIRSTPAAGD